MRRLDFRQWAAVLLAASVASPACVARSWRVADPASGGPHETIRAGDRIRATGSAGAVELEVTGGSYPLLAGRLRSGDGPVVVDLGFATGIEVAEPKGTAKQHDPRAVTASDVVSADVQVRTPSGSVALHVVALDGTVLRGRAIECRRAEDAPCTGVMQVDLRDFDRVEVRRVDTGATFAMNVFGLALAALAGYVGLVLLIGQQ